MSKPKHIPQEAWDAAQKLLVDGPVKWGFKNKDKVAKVGTDKIAAGTYIQKDGKHLSQRCYNGLTGHVCHSFIQLEYYTSCPLFFNTMVKTDIEGSREFLEWMKNDAPFSRYILNEDVDSMEHGGLIIDCTKIKSDTLLFICKIARTLYEDIFRVPIWYKLVKRGVHPMLALVVSQCVNSSLRDQEATTHNTCMMPPKTTEQMKKLFDLNTIEDRIKSEEPYGTWDTRKVFGHSDSYYSGWTRGKHLLPIVSGNGKKKKVPDGWGGYVEKEVPFSIDTLASDLIELQKEYI